jgi:hypothetical protein
MLKKLFLLVVFALGCLSHGTLLAAKPKHATAKHSTVSKKKKAVSSLAKNSKGKKASKGRGSKNSHMAKHRRRAGRKYDNVPAIDRTEPLQMIAQNQEKKRMSDSAHKEVFVNASKEEEGYFAALFSHQKKTTTFQTIEGTAAVFKSVSGWEDKKFYILTNELPVGTLVRITTPDLKSICAKVISALPEVSSNIKYRLNDAAAAILGITNKTFPISVTY